MFLSEEKEKKMKLIDILQAISGCLVLLIVVVFLVFGLPVLVNMGNPIEIEKVEPKKQFFEFLIG